METIKLELNKIYLGDAYELIKNVPTGSVDLIVTDPPYEIVAGGSGGCFGVEHRDYHQEYKTLGVSEHKREGLDEGKGSDPRNCVCVGFDYSLLDELDRIMKKINIYIWCNKNQISSLMKHYEDKGCNVDLLVWHKTNPIPTCNNKYLSDLEYCVFARESGVGLGGTYETKTKLFETSCNKADKDDYNHPTIKPLTIIETLVSNSTFSKDAVVFDPFSGSGTTCVAAKNLGLNYLGFEIDPEYHKIACDRLSGWNQHGEMDLFTSSSSSSSPEWEQISLFGEDNQEEK